LSAVNVWPSSSRATVMPRGVAMYLLPDFVYRDPAPIFELLKTLV
jgi:hypothetical protein